jgi:hypothetical protein
MEQQFNVSEAFCASIHQGMIVMVVKNINISNGRYRCTQIRTRIGSWNVQTLFQKGKLAQLNREMDRCDELH